MISQDLISALWAVDSGTRLTAICRAVALGCAAFALTASGTDLTLHSPGNPSIARQSAKYQRDANGTKIGVPAGSFQVEYINAGGNSLAVVPISGNALIFSTV